MSADRTMTKTRSKLAAPPLGRASPNGQAKHPKSSVLDTRQGNDVYRLMVENVDQLELILLDVQGRVRTWNRGAFTAKGYHAEEIIGKPVALFYPPDEVQAGKPQQELQTAVNTGRFEGRAWRLRKDGSRIWMHIIIIALRDRTGEHIGFVKLARDESERQKLELGRKETLETLRSSINRISSASAEVMASSTEQAAGAREQAAAVTEVMTTVEEVQQAADQALQRAKEAGDIAHKSVATSEHGRQVIGDSVSAQQRIKELVETTAENILALAEQAQSVGEIISLVNDIADQTNLLALNAAIEASRAGEHGRGFSVVAAEVKALADQSKKATGQVRQILGEIQKATNNAVLSIEEVTKSVASSIKLGAQAVESIASLATILEAAAQAPVQVIASASQQTTGMNQIHQAMKNIDLASRQAAAALQQTEKAMQDLNDLTAQLSGLMVD